MLAVVLAITIRPAVPGALHAGCAGFHVVLRVEVAACRVGRANRVNRGEALVVPELLERRETRVQAEMAVEIYDRVGGNRDARPLLIIRRLAMRDDHVQSVDGAALEEANERRTVGRSDGRTAGCEGRAREEEWIEAEAHQRQPARLHEDASRDGHCFWKSGPPKARPTASARACIGSVTSASCSRITLLVCADIEPASNCRSIVSTS